MIRLAACGGGTQPQQPQLHHDACSAGGIGDLYNVSADKARLAADGVSAFVTEVYEKRVRPQLTQDERARIGEVVFDVPTREGVTESIEDRCDAFLYYSYADAGRSRIVLPVLSLKFLFDLETALQWVTETRAEPALLVDYLTLLKYSSATPKRLAPLDAFEVPSDALEDPARQTRVASRYVAELTFIIGHELGHVLHGDTTTRTIDPSEQQRRETAADAFGLEILKRAGTDPTALVELMTWMAYWDRNRADFASTDEYNRYVRGLVPASEEQIYATHPVAMTRLIALSRTLDRMADEYAAAMTPQVENRPRVAQLLRGVAAAMQQLAEKIARPEAIAVMSWATIATYPDFTTFAKPRVSPEPVSECDVHAANELADLLVNGGDCDRYGRSRGELLAYVIPKARQSKTIDPHVAAALTRASGGSSRCASTTPHGAFVGTYNTTRLTAGTEDHLVVELVSSNHVVEGTFKGGAIDGRLRGLIEGSRFCFEWTANGASGSGVFEVSPDATGLAGTWVRAAGSNAEPWTGHR